MKILHAVLMKALMQHLLSSTNSLCGVSAFQWAFETLCEERRWNSTLENGENSTTFGHLWGRKNTELVLNASEVEIKVRIALHIETVNVYAFDTTG